MSEPHVVREVLVWEGCYDQSWRDLIVPAAFAHPAKMSRALLERIITHLFDLGAVERESLVLDPFGGIGTTAVIGASRGLRVVCCELEPKFVELARENIEMHRRDWEAMDLPQPIVIQGDSRYLRTALAYADALVSSPPYVSGGHHRDVMGAWNANGGGHGVERDEAGYGETPGQIGQLDEGSVEAIITSPPYAERDLGGDGQRKFGSNKTPDENKATRDGKGLHGTYGQTDGQLAGLATGSVEAIISSPPYAEIATGAGGLNTKPSQVVGQQTGRSATSASQETDQRYGQAEGQMARMPKGEVDAIVSSPPFTQGYSGGGGINVKGYGADGADKVGSRTYQALGAEREPGNLETLTFDTVEAVISSPPFERTGTLDHDGQTNKLIGNFSGGGKGFLENRYAAESPGQLGAMKGSDGVEAVVSSPPYERSMNSIEDAEARSERTSGFECGQKNLRYGQNPHTFLSKDPSGLNNAQRHEIAATNPQVGALMGETFWTAAHQVVQETFALVKPGGYAVWVVKAFVRDKKLVDFPGDWRKLCEHAGFITIQEIHASLVQETTHAGLFGDMTTKKERKSFFRRLAEKKGSPRIDYEVVWVMRKPA